MSVKKQKQRQLLIFLTVTFFATVLVSTMFFLSSTKSRLQTITVNGEILLTHGEDKDLIENLSETRILAEGGPAAFCEGDGKDGPRVQVIYAAAPENDHYQEKLADIRSIANEASNRVNRSAAKTGGQRIIRYVMDPGCIVNVAKLTTTKEGLKTAGTVIYEAKTHGFNKLNRKYMIIAEVDDFCGLSSLDENDSPDPSKHMGNTYGVIGNMCFNPGAFLHELFHGLGAVQKSAPNATANMHCVDDYDQMCRKDADDVIMRLDCTSEKENEPLLDCNNNDYFNTNPASESYLATHWNAANSPYLDDPTIKEPVPTVEPTKKPKQNKKKNKATKKQSGKKNKR